MSEKLKEIDACITIVRRQRAALLEAIRADETALLATNALNLDGSAEHAYLAESALRRYMVERNGFHQDQVKEFDEILNQLNDLYREEYAASN